MKLSKIFFGACEDIKGVQIPTRLSNEKQVTAIGKPCFMPFLVTGNNP